MPTTGNINVNWDDMSTGVAVPKLTPYPNVNLDIQKPADIISQFTLLNKPLRGRIWKMRRVNTRNDPNFDDSLHQYDTFVANGITGNTDVILDQV